MTQTPYTDARDLLVRRAVSTPAPTIEPGSSSYFSKPTNDADPRLFAAGSDRLYPAVREWVLKTVYDFWGQRYSSGPAWSTVWIAGSGITHQWSANRGGIGDLDVLIGVDFTSFRYHNPRFQGMGEVEIAAILNDEFKTELDPLTATWQGFEVTFYVNPGAQDIRDINPYAAYDVTHDRWTVHPISIPSDWDPDQYFPLEWQRAIRDEAQQAKSILDDYRRLRQQCRGAKGPQRVNLAAQLEVVVRNGARLFNDIHLARRNAFSHDGKGYMDWYNYRWQAHKRDGVVPALHTLATLLAEAEQAQEKSLYGEVLTDSQAALSAAAMANAVMDRLEVRR